MTQHVICLLVEAIQQAQALDIKKQKKEKSTPNC